MRYSVLIAGLMLGLNAVVLADTTPHNAAPHNTTQNDMAQVSEAGDYVVILHGILRSSSHMARLARHLRTQGYDVINIDYPSTAHELEALADLTQQNIALRLTQEKPVHFIGYSMSGLMVRAILHQYRPAHLGRIVLLAPPNRGSEVADLLKDHQLYQKIFGPAGQQLTTDQRQIENLFGDVDYELGIIAGNKTLSPLSSLIIQGPDDGKVSVASTKLNGMADHITIPAAHSFVPYNKITRQQTAHFLKYGKFERK